jgi:hypothetical protein
MIENIPQMEIPKWLVNIKPKNYCKLPLKEILKDSFYYPSSGLDGNPIKSLTGNVYSFIYVDYGVTKQKLDSAIEDGGFKGYRLLMSREVAEEELFPDGKASLELSRNDGDPQKYRSWMKAPFIKWMIFEHNNDDDLDNNDGAESRVEKFSLLYIGAEGVSTFNSLYLSNQLSPLAVAVIQPGHGFGGNWTNYTDTNQVFYKTVFNNPNGIPKYLMYGGWGQLSSYEETCWPKFSEEIWLTGKTGRPYLSVWAEPSLH